MFDTIAIFLILLWLAGMAAAIMFGGYIHVLLYVAVVMFLVRMIHGKRV
jgi:hypothetical protein